LQPTEHHPTLFWRGGVVWGGFGRGCYSLSDYIGGGAEGGRAHWVLGPRRVLALPGKGSMYPENW
jgi:hypothetical protein